MTAVGRQAMAESAYNAVHQWAEFVDRVQFDAHGVLPHAQWLQLRDFADVAYAAVLDIANATFERLGGHHD